MSMAMHPYSTHQSLLVAAMARTSGPIVEMGGGWYSTPLVNTFSLAFGRPALTVETGSYVFNLLKGLLTFPHEMDLLEGFDFDTVGKFSPRKGLSISDYIRKQTDYLAKLDSRVFGSPSVILIDQAPGFLRTPSIEFFAERSEFIVIHDSEHVEHYHYEPILSTFRYRWDFRLHRPQSVVVSNKRDCAIFDYLSGQSNAGVHD